MKALLASFPEFEWPEIDRQSAESRKTLERKNNFFRVFDRRFAEQATPAKSRQTFANPDVLPIRFAGLSVAFVLLFAWRAL
jgi:hypothetical protein